MRLTILIGGKAGQGINKISEIISKVLKERGYFIFNYRDYPSVIRGDHNFNILTISDSFANSTFSKLDGLLALDELTLKLHKEELSKNPFIFSFKEFENSNLGINLNIALAAALLKTLGVEKSVLIKEIRTFSKDLLALKAIDLGYHIGKPIYALKKLQNKINLLSGTQAIAQGALNSGIDIYLSYPMTPSTGVLHELGEAQLTHPLFVFQPEDEIAVVNAALGASFAGAKVLIGTSGGGFDLMSEALSLQGQTEIPLVIYLSSRPGPGTGLPTYTSQSDLNAALRAGHGEFPRLVIAPGDPIEALEKTNEAFYLSQKFNLLAILLADKHLVESEFSTNRKPNKILKIKVTRKIPGKALVKVNSYEHDLFGNTTESSFLAKKNAEKRLEKYQKLQAYCKRFEMVKFYGKKNSKNLVLGWGSTKTAILDAIQDLDAKFLQILYLKPLSDQIKKEIQEAHKVILVENNSTGQLGYLIREKTGLKISNRILKYDGRPFQSDKLREELKKYLK